MAEYKGLADTLKELLEKNLGMAGNLIENIYAQESYRKNLGKAGNLIENIYAQESLIQKNIYFTAFSSYHTSLYDLMYML